jgi:hypothetical protein
MSPTSKREYLAVIRERYAQASKADKGQILDEVCSTLHYHRKAAIRVLTGPPPRRTRRSARCRTYGEDTIRILKAIWTAAGYPWSVRLKALLPLWLPWAKQRWALPPTVEQQLRGISPRTIDRCLRAHKHALRRRLYGRTKPGTLLRHQIPIRTERQDTTTPGFGEIDLVAHCGSTLEGEHCWSVNFTDLATAWVETRAVLGRHHRGVCAALDEIAQALPCPLHGLDSDNDVAFINDHLLRYCRVHHIQFTRSRAYKKDDNAHIEQKNWTHVRKLLGWDRYDTPDACAAMNDLYRHEWRLMMNLFQPSVKVVRKIRVGARLRRVYGPAQTPLDRLLIYAPKSPQAQAFQQLRATLDPFALADAIERRMERISRLVNRTQPARQTRRRSPQPFQITMPSSSGERPSVLTFRLRPSVTSHMARR